MINIETEYEQSCLVFAARYAHKRPTAAAFVVVSAIVDNWNNISRSTQIQIKKEIDDATENHEDWDRIRELVVRSKMELPSHAIVN